MEERCYVCRGVVEAKYGMNHKPTCERCMQLLRAPPCRACGEPVRDALPGDEPYHEMCRRCSSCFQVIAKDDCVNLAGRLLCKPCDHLFGKFFLPDRRGEGDRMKEAFNAWDTDGSGSIEKRELRRVLKALNPDLAERDLERLIDAIDKDGNGTIEYDEFVDWMMGGSSLALPEEESFEGFVAGLMHEAGIATNQAKMGIGEVQLRPDGLVFVMSSGTELKQCSGIKADSLELMVLDPEEFLCSIENTEEGLRITTNTGRKYVMKTSASKKLFGPWVAPDGFRIVGIRTKPDESKAGEHIVGVNLGPLPAAKHYDAGAALRFAAEHEFLYTLQRLLSKAQIDVNSFGPGGVTALMAAAQNGGVASMRMLLGSKAKPNLTDVEGWTALTYATACGRDTAVEVLLDKGGSVQEGDAGAALKEALRHQHNSAARALLRAGFGPAPAGTFALEDFDDPAKFTLKPPGMEPPAGVFAKPVFLEFSWGDVIEEEPEEGEEAEMVTTTRKLSTLSQFGVKILYTLDGRDPCTAGKQYKKPVKITQPRTRVRAVAIRGSERSVVVDSVYVVCHYVMPDDVVSGTLEVRTFPEGFETIAGSIAEVVGENKERVSVQAVDPNAAIVKGSKIWLRVPLTCPRPRHWLHIDRSFSTVRGPQKKAFLEKLAADLEKALGEAPENMSVAAQSSSMKSNFKAGSTVVEFMLSREKAGILGDMLQDTSCWLMTKSKHRTMYPDCELQMMEPLGARLGDHTLHTNVQSALGVPTDEVVGLGTGEAGDSGVLAVACSTGDAAKLKKRDKLTKVIKELLNDTDLGELRESPALAQVEYTVDVLAGKEVRKMPAGRASVIAKKAFDARQAVMKDGGTVVKEFNQPDFTRRLMFQLADDRLPADVKPVDKASSRELSKLQFLLEWGNAERKEKTSAGRIRDFLDGICIVYAGSRLAQIIDFKSAKDGSSVFDGEENEENLSLARAINRAVQHSGDVHMENGGAHKMDVDLSALPLQVTDIFFVLAAFEADNLSLFTHPKVEIREAMFDRTLTQYSLASAGKSQAIIMCSFTRDPNHKKWVVHGLGIKTPGNAKDYGPIRETIARRQADYLRWERRSALVTVRALHKCGRITQGSHSKFAIFLWNVLELPTSVFQLLTTWL